MANPLFNDKAIENAGISRTAMTVSGAIGKSFLLTLVTAATAYFGWQNAQIVSPFIIPLILVAFGAVIFSYFKPTSTPIVAPIYAILEGVALGAISYIYNQQWNGIVLQALMLTFGILFAMLVLYQTRIVRVTEKFRSVIVLATAGIAILYIGSMVANMFGANLSFINGATPFSIGLNVVIAIIASLNFLLDFDNIEKGAAAHAPKYMEWTAAMGLLITIIWLYLEILRLLSQLNRR
ncbi:MAG: Bax inhibitor-1/YccA family protein [Chthoniobacterales bacterium]